MTADEYRELRQGVDTPHGGFAYVEVGEGPASVFVHGLFMSGYMWHGVVDQLKGERRCVVYNLPVHGGSEVAEDQPLDLASQAEMLEGFCDAVGLETFDLVANDTGGAIAQAFTLRAPERVRSLTLTNCEARDWMPSKHELGQLVAQLAEQGHLAALVKGFYDDIDSARSSAFADPYQWPDRISDEQLRAIMEPHQATLEGARQVERFARALVPEDLASLEPQLRRLQVPTIAVWGTGDEIFPLELARWLEGTIPGFRRLVTVEDGKLFWPFERPGELVPHLRSLWAEVAPSPAAN
jgi:pimeloyl-ACP methyl ester carboxylesterase